MGIWESILQDVTYRPGVRISYVSGALTVTLDGVEDAVRGGTKNFSFTWDVPEDITADGVLHLLGEALMEVEAHECREMLKYRGRRLMRAHRGEHAEVELNSRPNLGVF